MTRGGIGIVIAVVLLAVIVCFVAVYCTLAPWHRKLEVMPETTYDLEEMAEDILWFMPQYARHGAYDISGGYRVFVVQGVPELQLGDATSATAFVTEVRRRAAMHVHLLSASHSPSSGKGGGIPLPMEAEQSVMAPRRFIGCPSIAPGSSDFNDMRIMLVYERKHVRGVMTLCVDQEPSYAVLTIAEFPWLGTE